MGSDEIWTTKHCICLYFNPRSPHGERQRLIGFCKFSSLFQSTLPHGERQEEAAELIHAISFQSTLPHGERRPYRLRIGFPLWYFNPRSRMGSDYHQARQHDHNYISIHAPAWGATPDWITRSACFSHFNPRSRMGSDGIQRNNSPMDVPFQSTLPHGERPEREI